MEIVETKLSKLIFAEYNPRQLSKDQFQQIKDSITRFGIVDPIIVNSNKDRKNIIIGGHQRVKVALEMGIDTIPCHFINLTRDKERELNIRLNKNTGEWDWDILSGAFDVDELIEWGFSEDELDFPEPIPSEGLTDEDAVPEVEEPITKLGDLWLLGEHRVLCGDATISTDVDRLMDGEKADMVFTDPPYNVDYGANVDHPSHKIRSIKNDKMSDIDWNTFVGDYLNSLLTNCDGNFYIFMSDKELGHLQLKFTEAGGRWGSFIIWVKDSLVLSAKDYHSKHETMLFGWSQGIKERIRVEDRKQTDVWEFSRPKRSEEHPTMKPVELIELALKNSSKVSSGVLDLFLGSGSTLIACEKTNRKCYGMELDPHYCDVMVKRWEDFTGKKAELG